MADTKLNQFVSCGTAAARAAYTPSPPTPASGPTPGYFWHETDTGDTYSWKAGTGWIKVNTGGAGLSDGDKGDITVSSSGAAWAIDNDVVTYAKMQNVSATSRILGRKTASAGDTEECTLSEVLDMIGSAAQGDILYRGSSAWARLGAGTSGYFLQTQGAGANPQWASAGGGGTVSVVQYKSFIGNTPTLTMDAAPTAGNMLVFMSTHWTGVTVVSAGWSAVLNSTGSVTDGVFCAVRVANGTDAGSATITNPTNSSGGQNITIFEVSGALPIVSLIFDSYKEFSGTTKDLLVSSAKAGTLIVGMSATVSANTAPSGITNATALTTVTGTASNASPRQITPFKKENVSPGVVTITPTYASSCTMNGVAIALMPA